MRARRRNEAGSDDAATLHARPMPTLLNSAECEAIVQRLRRLQPDSRARWGTLTAPRMVCHLADSLRVGLGDLPARPIHNLASRTLVKWLVVYSPVQPPKGKIQTAPEFLTTAPTSWPDDVATVERLIARLAATPTTATHPAF